MQLDQGIRSLEAGQELEWVVVEAGAEEASSVAEVTVEGSAEVEAGGGLEEKAAAGTLMDMEAKVAVGGAVAGLEERAERVEPLAVKETAAGSRQTEATVLAGEGE